MNAGPPPVPRNSVLVSILITNWNGRDLLRDAIRSIIDRTQGLTYEIIVVDDASSDGSPEMVRTEFPEARLIVNDRNLGFVGANNRGILWAQGTYVLLLNSDTIVLNNTVKILADFLDSHPETGVCGGFLVNPDMTGQVSFGSFPSFSQALVDALFLNDLFPHAGLPNRGTIPQGSSSVPIATNYVTGADMMIRRQLIDRFGLFDEQFQAYCEEVDFCYRVKQSAHMGTAFVPEARVIHLGGMSYGKLGKKQTQTQYASYNTFLTKHHGRLYAFFTRLLYAWHYCVKLIFRTAAYFVARGPEREHRRAAVLKAWYCIRYSLAPES